MKPKNFSIMMKAVIIMIAVFGALFYFLFVPMMAKEMQYYANDIVNDITYCNRLYYAWLILIWLTSVPCYAVLVFAWKMANSVKNDTQFSHKNSGRLSKIALLAFIDGAFFFLMNIIYLFANLNHPGILIASFLVFLVAIAFAATAKVLAGMVDKAAVLQEENDLTI